MPTDNDAFIFRSVFRSGLVAVLSVRIPPPGECETFYIDWSGPPPRPRDWREYERFKQVIATELSKVSGRPHWLEDSPQVVELFRPARRRATKAA